MSSNVRTTVDEKESDFFKNLSPNWWNNPELKLLYSSCDLFVPYICEKIQEKYPDKPLQSVCILEVGCGGGFLTERLARFGCNLVAIDINDDLLQIAKAHSESDPTLPKITYLAETIEEHCKKNLQKYDVVISNFVLEHVADHDYFIKCCSDCVKPNGLLFMSAVAKTFLRTHDYNKCITASEAESIMRSYDFTIINTKGIFYNVIKKTVLFFPTNTFAYIISAARNAE